MPDALAAIIAAARRLIDAVTFDDSGTAGRGGNGGLVSRDTIHRADELRLAIAAAEATAKSGGDPYDRGRRDMLNALLELNPEVAAKLAFWAERDPDPVGRLPFDVSFWIHSVADQLGIKPRSDHEGTIASPDDTPAEDTRP